MSAIPTIHQLVIYSLIALLVWGAVTDYREYIIPNRICLAIAGLYPSYVLASPVAVDWLAAVGGAAIIFVVSAAFFFLRLTGGGDVKLLAATALWPGPDLFLPFLLITSVAGGILSLAALMHLEILRPRSVSAAALNVPRASHFKERVPYGLAIVTGGLYVAFRLLTG